MRNFYRRIRVYLKYIIIYRVSNMKYVCKFCSKEFDKKDSYMKHMDRKVPCIDNKESLYDTINRLNDKMKLMNFKIKKLERKLSKEKITTPEGLTKMYNKIYSLLINKEGLSRERAMDQFNFVFSIKLLEPLIINKIIDLPNECLFSDLTDIYDSDELHEKVVYAISLFMKNSTTRDFFDKLDIRDPETIYKLIKYINRIDFENLDNDVREKLYEYFVRTKENMMAIPHTYRDMAECMATEFDRLGHLELDEDGNIPSICEPNCIFGGFLFAIVSKLMHKYPNLDWSKQQSIVEGYCYSPLVMRSTKLNLLCLTGVIFENIYQKDTITENLNQEKYDIIVGQPPDFSLRLTKTQKHQLSSDIKNINGNHRDDIFDFYDSIFTGLYMTKMGNVCGIVLPLFRWSTQLYDAIREEIIENCKIKYIFHKEKDDYKLYPNIVIFESGKTDQVEFIDFKKREEEDRIIVSQTIEDIRNQKYSLDFKKYVK